MTNEVRDIPTKNYIFLVIIMLFSMLLVYYLYLWYQTYEESKFNTPIMDNYLQIINYNELSSYLLESESTIVYVSVVGDEGIRNFENKFKNTVVKYSFSNMLYMDITDELNNDISLDYKLNRGNVPCILVFEGNELLDTYYIDVNNYSMKKIRKYLMAMGDTDED